MEKHTFTIVRGASKIVVTLYGNMTQQKQDKAFKEAHRQLDSFVSYDKYLKGVRVYKAEEEAKEAAFNMHMIRTGRFDRLEEINYED